MMDELIMLSANDNTRDAVAITPIVSRIDDTKGAKRTRPPRGDRDSQSGG